MTVASGRKVVWCCAKHQPAFTWAAMVNHRTKISHPSGCPECATAAKRAPRPGKVFRIQAKVAGMSQLKQTFMVTAISTISIESIPI